MNKFHNGLNLSPSLLDRLLEDEQAISSDTRTSTTWDIEKMIESLRRDLEALLSTRAAFFEQNLPELQETRQSIFFYGLPDLAAFNPQNPKDLRQLTQVLENVIRTFEPRLQQVRVTMNGINELDRTLRFTIEGVPKMNAGSEPVVFETALAPSTGECKVEKVA
jgi:type VI secretion system protein ImpF